MPRECDHALEIGCGTGRFTRELARRARLVTAIDLSPEMIRIARERTRGLGNIEFLIGDVAEFDLQRDGFDVIVAIAALHHLPLASTLPRLQEALRPGGTLIVHDVLTRRGLWGFAKNLVAYASRVVRGGLPPWLFHPELRDAWQNHGRDELYPTIDEARALYGALLPGASVTEQLEWRYTVVWRRPA
jgi:SAM-dependent methyltransferase